MSITTATRDKVALALQTHGLGRGLTVPQLRRAYPAGAVRRTAILEALRDLEAMGQVTWVGERVRWVGPLEVDRVLGEPLARILRDRGLDQGTRLARAAALSAALAAGRGRG